MGEGVLNRLKKCHVLFEWPLKVSEFECKQKCLKNTTHIYHIVSKMSQTSDPTVCVCVARDNFKKIKNYTKKLWFTALFSSLLWHVETFFLPYAACELLFLQNEALA